MAENPEISGVTEESMMGKISEKHHGHDSSSSSSDSETDKPSSPSSVKSKFYRLFGRQKPVHQILGGGKRTLLSLSLSHTHTHTCTSQILGVPLLNEECYLIRLRLVWNS